jgi:hypothetical protein
MRWESNGNREIEVGQPGLHWSQRTTFDPVSSCEYETAAAELRRPRTRTRSHRTPIILAVVVFLVVAAGVAAFLLINAKNTAAAEQKAKTAALAQMGTYTDNSTGVSFLVPTPWQQIPLDDAVGALAQVAAGLDAMPSGFVAFGEGNLVTGGSGPGAVMFFAAQDYPGGAAMSVKEMLDGVMAQAKEYPLGGLSIEGDVKEIEGAAIDGAQFTAKVTRGGQTALMRLAFLDSGSCYYMFVFGADEYTWEEARHFFDGTVESFSLTGAQ